MFDTPVFKILAPNDTSERPGHQGGIVIPKDIENFFPDMTGIITAQNPTEEVFVEADLFVGSTFMATVRTRYQYQTWGGTRGIERRLTANLSALRREARGGDIVLFSRDNDVPTRMSVTLLKAGDPRHSAIVAASGGKRWGMVPGLPTPTSNVEIRDAEQEIAAFLNNDFRLFDLDRQVVERQSKRKARNKAFRDNLILNYGSICMLTAESILSASGMNNIDAAHIVPVEAGGSDDPRNGLLLSKDMHWAFDKGLVFFADDFTVGVRAIPPYPNLPLARIAGQRLNFGHSRLRPHLDAIRWHRERRLG